MDIHIRRALIKDASGIQKLNAAELGAVYPVGKTRQILTQLLQSEQDRIYVAEIEGTIVGYVHACNYTLLCSPPIKNIMSIAISKDYQKHGIGKVLLERIENWAKETEASIIRIISDGSGINAYEYYKNLGYEGGKLQMHFTKKL